LARVAGWSCSISLKAYRSGAGSAVTQDLTIVWLSLKGVCGTGSHEALLHQAGLPAYCLDLRNAPKSLAATLEHSRLQRSVGVIYCNTDADTVGQTSLCTALLGVENV
jgi:hypothetical protein